MTRRTSLYDVLGVAPSATLDDIRGAYRRSARVLHPDAGGSAAAFERLTMAYHVLADPARRSKYDRYLAVGGDAAPTGTGAAQGGAQGGPSPGRHRPPGGRTGPSMAAFAGVSRGARRGYLVMMAVALTLFILAGTVVRPASVPAAMAMALVAMVIPPIAAIVVNRPGARSASDPGATRPVDRDAAGR